MPPNTCNYLYTQPLLIFFQVLHQGGQLRYEFRSELTFEGELLARGTGDSKVWRPYGCDGDSGEFPARCYESLHSWEDHQEGTQEAPSAKASPSAAANQGPDGLPISRMEQGEESDYNGDVWNGQDIFGLLPYSLGIDGDDTGRSQTFESEEAYWDYIRRHGYAEGEGDSAGSPGQDEANLD